MGKNKDVDKGSKGKDKKYKEVIDGWRYMGISIGIVLVVLSLLDFYFSWGILDSRTQPTLAQALTLSGAIISLSLFFQRLELQRAQRLDDRFTTTVNLLGSDQTSARTGAVYSLYQLALEDAKYRSQIAQILCSHVRSNTSAPEYQENHKDHPSNEIQTAVNLLVREVNGTGGLYWQGFKAGLPRIDFNHAYLVGADFKGARCQGADFRDARCQRADFFRAQCQGANFHKAWCPGANFREARCQRADFSEAECQGADFEYLQCQEAYFSEAQCQGAYFIGAQCQGAGFEYAQCPATNFIGAQCQGAYFSEAQCQGAYFIGAQCQNVSFSDARCQGVNFSEAQCQGASFYGAQCQGAYVAENIPSLKDRIGKQTELTNMIIDGELSEYDIQCIEEAKKYCPEYWYTDMQRVIERNKGRAQVQGVPRGIIEGILEDSEEIQAIISRDWEKLAAIQEEG